MRYLLIYFILFHGLTLSIAQSATKQHTKKTPEQKANNQVQKLSQELSLTPEQTTQIKAIYLECDQQLDSLKQQEKAVREKKKASLKQVLTPEQYNTYMDTQKRGGRKAHGASPNTSGTPNSSSK